MTVLLSSTPSLRLKARRLHYVTPHNASHVALSRASASIGSVVNGAQLLGTTCCDGTAVSIHCSWTGSRRRLGDPGLRTERGVKDASLILDATAETSGETRQRRRLPFCLPRSLSRFFFSSSFLPYSPPRLDLFLCLQGYYGYNYYRLHWGKRRERERTQAALY